MKLLPNNLNWEACVTLKVKVLVAQSCPTLCNPVDCNPPVSSVCGILQARILEWVAMSFSRGSSWLRDQTQVFCIAGRFVYGLSHQGSPCCYFTFGLTSEPGRVPGMLAEARSSSERRLGTPKYASCQGTTILLPFLLALLPKWYDEGLVTRAHTVGVLPERDLRRKLKKPRAFITVSKPVWSLPQRVSLLMLSRTVNKPAFSSGMKYYLFIM